MHLPLFVQQEMRVALKFQGSSAADRDRECCHMHVKDISFAEYRLLRALSDAPNAWASRVDLAQTVGLTPSGVTRALRLMEQLGYVATAKSKRDARLALASLTPAGQDLVNDASGVVDDIMKTILERSPKIYSKLDEMIVLLEDFGGQAIQGIG